MPTNNKLTIAQLVISKAWGGAENVAFNFARHLSDVTQQYIIVNEELIRHYTPLEEDGVRIVSLGKFFDCSPWFRPLRYFRARQIIKNAVRDENIDIVHFHLVWGMIAYYSLFRKLNRSTAITLHGNVRSAYLGMRNRIEEYVLWRSLKYRIDAVVSCSNELLDYVKKSNAYRSEITTVIPNGIDLHEWKDIKPIDFMNSGDQISKDEEVVVPADDIALADEDSKRPEPFRILFVGQMRPNKGMDLLVEAIHRIDQDRMIQVRDMQVGGGTSTDPHTSPDDVDIEAYIIGKGDLMPKMQQMVSDYELEDRVHLLGFVEKEMMYRYYKSCDILASLCDWEGCSIVQLEALASGIPLIATAVGGTPEIIKDRRNGFLIERDVASIKDAILKAVRNPKLLGEMRQNNLEDSQQYAWENIVKRYLEIYKTLGSTSEK